MNGSASARMVQAMSRLAERITDRDRMICNTLYEHPVLTVDEIYELHFDSLERARKRLTQLHQLQVLGRFRPYRTVGSSPYHYVLDQLGAHVVAVDRGLDVAQLAWSRSASLRLASSQQLTHLIEASGFFTHLAYALRGRGQLRAWWGQRRCAQAWGELVRPDGYAYLRVDRASLEVWVEWDRGTETHARLQDKLDRYQELALALERQVTLLIVLHSDRREHEVCGRLRDAGGVHVLTSTAARHAADPLGRNWLADGSERRLSLPMLAATVTASASIFSRRDRDTGPADPPGSSAGPTTTDQAMHNYS